jgi:hypothetical protein
MAVINSFMYHRKGILFVILFLSFSFSLTSSFAQLKLTATICDQNKKPVPFTNVVSTQKRNGTATDENGKFTLIGIDKNDTLKITGVGYQSLLIPVKQIKNNDTLFLRDDIKILDEVTVRDWTIYKNPAKLGFFTYSKHNFFMLDQGLEVGLFIENTSGRKALIKSVYFGVYNEGVKPSILRVRLFGVNDEGQPGIDLLTANVLINTGHLQHKNNIDLSAYNILMPGNGIFVIIECVSEPEGIEQADKVSLTLNMNYYKNLLWTNYRDKHWGHYPIPRRENGNYITPDIGLEVAYPGN